MSYTHYPSLHLPTLTEQTLARWRADNTFKKSLDQRAQSPRFNLYEGPPSANGKPGIHHVLSRSLKDLIGRYKTMKGYYVPRQSGWDTHGLPIELQAEKELGITKEDIGTKISVADYNAYCKKIVLRFQKEWNELTERVGYWTDLDNPYLTYSTDYIATVWEILQQLHKKDMLYKGFTIQPYSPAAGTGLSTHELNQPGCYKMVKDTTIVAQFQLIDQLDTYLLAWTTTPWTLPANTALALGPKITYVKVETFNRYTQKPVYVILAEKALERYFDPAAAQAPMQPPKNPSTPLPWRKVASYTGQELCGRSYHQLMPYIQPEGKAFYTVPADFVTTEDGTGIVHIAPTFGLQDYQLAQQKGLPSIMVTREQGAQPIVDKQGRFVEEITDFAHQYVKPSYDTSPKDSNQPAKLSVDIQIAKQLKKSNKAFLVAAYSHSYPHCWRTDKPVLYYPLDSWFIKTTAYKKQLIAHNKTIGWQPPATGIGRFQNWLENLVDWNVSRSRFWGTPLPIWRTKDGTEEKCIGTVRELQEEIAHAVSAGVMTQAAADRVCPADTPSKIDLHRPYVDDIILVSSKGEKMYRESDVVDVWLDSGAMPYAHQSTIPLQAYKEATPPPHFPADCIAEGIDQTRGWFFTLHVLGVMLFDTVAYKNVLATGLVLDKNGNKMSKRHGNTINPIELIDHAGPDAIRWYMIVNSSPWDNLKFDKNGVEEVKKRFFGTLYNTYQFFSLYASIDGYTPQKGYPDLSKATRADRWILSRLQQLTQTVTEAYDSYHPTPAARAIQHFVIEDLSNWYVRLGRKRFWAGGHTADKQIAYHTLYVCLQTVAQLAAPIAPFYMDQLYHDLTQGKEPSVHLTDFPTPIHALYEEELEAQMAQAQKITSLIHALRKKHKVKVRQPLQKMLLPIHNLTEKQHIQAVEGLILTEVNVKELHYVDDTQAIVHKQARPNFQTAGKKYGAQVKELAQALAQMSQKAIQALEKEGACTLTIQGKVMRVPLADVQLITTDLPGWAVASEAGRTVALDLHITPALQAEGWARDIVNKIQNLRKSEGLDVQDKIALSLWTDTSELKQAIQTHHAYILGEVQAPTLHWDAETATTAQETITLGTASLAIRLRVQR